jgi:hypothetical protein
LVGAAITAIALDGRFYNTAVSLGAAFVCFAIRLAGLHLNLNLPIAHPPNVEDTDDGDGRADR